MEFFEGFIVGVAAAVVTLLLAIGIAEEEV